MKVLACTLYTVVCFWIQPDKWAWPPNPLRQLLVTKYCKNSSIYQTCANLQMSLFSRCFFPFSYFYNNHNKVVILFFYWPQQCCNITNSQVRVIELKGKSPYTAGSIRYQDNDPFDFCTDHPVTSKCIFFLETAGIILSALQQFTSFISCTKTVAANSTVQVFSLSDLCHLFLFSFLVCCL